MTADLTATHVDNSCQRWTLIRAYGIPDPLTGNAIVNVDVTEVNDPPPADDDDKSTPEDTELIFPASDLTVNDSAGPANETGQPLTVIAVTSASVQGGTVTLVGGVITYTPGELESGENCSGAQVTLCCTGQK